MPLLSPAIPCLWAFQSEEIQPEGAESTLVEGAGTGPWLDNLQVWEYIPPTMTCGALDPGQKGIILSPYESVLGGTAAIIRHGDRLALDELARSDVDWVRLELEQKNDDFIDLLEYDLMVDALCAKGISVLGLVDYKSLERQDFDDPATAVAYWQAFSQQVAGLVAHFAGRVTYWEVWNEPDNRAAAFVRPELYAPLLTESYEAIKMANPSTKVLFGGLASAWDPAFTYLNSVYEQWNVLETMPHPFDYLAIHPYTDGMEEFGGHGLDPRIYMHTTVNGPTILDKFTNLLADSQDGEKKFWVTELGWNSSYESTNGIPCQAHTFVTEAQQAAYLKPGFDILLHEVYLADGSTTAVEKVFWYQYMDVGIENFCPPPPASISNRGLITLASPDESRDWLFGLYRSNKVTPKPVRCEFWAYPVDCATRYSWHAYLPSFQTQDRYHQTLEGGK